MDDTAPVADSAPAPTLLDLAAAAPQEALDLYRAIQNGRFLLALPWTQELRPTRQDVNGKLIAEVFAVGLDPETRVPLYGGRVLGRTSEVDLPLDDQKDWADRVLMARAHHLI